MNVQNCFHIAHIVRRGHLFVLFEEIWGAQQHDILNQLVVGLSIDAYWTLKNYSPMLQNIRKKRLCPEYAIIVHYVVFTCQHKLCSRWGNNKNSLLITAGIHMWSILQHFCLSCRICILYWAFLRVIPATGRHNTDASLPKAGGVVVVGRGVNMWLLLSRHV
jgi:hypothetical protein